MKTKKSNTINTKNTNKNFDLESSITVLTDELLSLVAGGTDSGGVELPDPIHVPPTGQVN